MFAKLAIMFQAWLGAGGLPILFLISFFENTLLPVPGEIVLPVAGFLVNQEVYPYWLAVLVATLGATAGASTTYAIGRFGGIPLVKRYGKWLGITNKELKRSENYFAKYGIITIFFCRFIPAIRQLSSLPAGAAKMRYSHFFFATFLGALLWNSFLIGLGWYFGDAWQQLLEYSGILNIIGLVVFIAIMVWFFRTHAPRIAQQIDLEEERNARVAKRAEKKNSQPRSSKAPVAVSRRKKRRANT